MRLFKLPSGTEIGILEMAGPVAVAIGLAAASFPA